MEGVSSLLSTHFSTCTLPCHLCTYRPPLLSDHYQWQAAEGTFAQRNLPCSSPSISCRHCPPHDHGTCQPTHDILSHRHTPAALRFHPNPTSRLKPHQAKLLHSLQTPLLHPLLPHRSLLTQIIASRITDVVNTRVPATATDAPAAQRRRQPDRRVHLLHALCVCARRAFGAEDDVL